jgi:spore germination cell wall hydrolase CwlJ-like protein
MASIINCEAGGESYQGKLAVGIVVMNRVDSKLFPNTIRKVIYQKGQFSPVRNGSLKKKLAQYDAGKTTSKQWKDCISAAKKVLEGRNYIIYKGSKKNMDGYYFFSVYLSGARFRLGGHRFK